VIKPNFVCFVLFSHHLALNVKPSTDKKEREKKHQYKNLFLTPYLYKNPSFSNLFPLYWPIELHVLLCACIFHAINHI